MAEEEPLPFTWMQTADEVAVKMPIAKAIKSKDIVYKLGRSKLLLGIRGETPVIDCYDKEVRFLWFVYWPWHCFVYL